MSLKQVEQAQYLVDVNLTKKFTDFYEMFLTRETCPKVLAFKLGNLTLGQLHHYFSENWDTIINLLTDGSLIMAYRDSIKIIRQALYEPRLCIGIGAERIYLWRIVYLG